MRRRNALIASESANVLGLQNRAHGDVAADLLEIVECGVEPVRREIGQVGARRHEPRIVDDGRVLLGREVVKSGELDTDEARSRRAGGALLRNLWPPVREANTAGRRSGGSWCSSRDSFGTDESLNLSRAIDSGTTASRAGSPWRTAPSDSRPARRSPGGRPHDRCVEPRRGRTPPRCALPRTVAKNWSSVMRLEHDACTSRPSVRTSCTARWVNWP